MVYMHLLLWTIFILIAGTIFAGFKAGFIAAVAFALIGSAIADYVIHRRK